MPMTISTFKKVITQSPLWPFFAILLLIIIPHIYSTTKKNPITTSAFLAPLIPVHIMGRMKILIEKKIIAHSWKANEIFSGILKVLTCQRT